MKKKVTVFVYVDDMLIATKSMVGIKKLREQLSDEFEMKDLGMKIHMDRHAEKGYIDWNANAKSMGTSLAAHFRLSVAQSPQFIEEEEQLLSVPYASTIRGIIYGYFDIFKVLQMLA